MVDVDPLRTQRDPIASVAEELAAAGFSDAHEIGHGGFGIVYRCRQNALDRTVAVKVLTSDLDQESLERFVREQRAMGKLSGHPNIVSILMSGVIAAGRPYIVMPFHPNLSLQDRLVRSGPLTWTEATRIGVKMAGALEAAHRADILHRDVKPGNILLSEYDEPELTDFGIAHISGGFVTTSGVITGSPAFSAPEVLKGHQPTVASDIYGLGATLFCLITGHAAYERRVGEKLVSHFLRVASDPVPDLRERDIPDDLCSVIERAMSEDPDDRFESAAQFGEQLRAIQERHGVGIDQMALPADGSAATVAIAPRRPGTGKVSRTTPTPPSALTKFRPPTSTRPLVVRERLIESLRSGGRRRLTVIHAPAGFGKSTLAAQWRDVLVSEGTHVAWLSVDHDDDTVVWFLAHLIEALMPVRPRLADELGQLLEQHGDEAEPYVLTSLINEIHEHGEHVAVVIDDWHRVSNPTTIAALGYLLDHGCHHLQVIVTSRTRGGLPLSKMRMHDELVEISSNMLRFNISEASEFFAGAGGPTLTGNEVADLIESTDGWVAALQLAALSLRTAENPGELIFHMSGHNHSLGEFLAENVLDTLEPRMLDFLLRTSIVERLNASLAAALVDSADGAALLDEAQARDLFLNRDDENREWCRYHHLFADFLRRRLERDHPEWIADLHSTASAWFATHGLLSEAVDHALAAGDDHMAVALVESGGTQLLEQSQMSTLLALIAKLPLDDVRSNPRLQLAMAWSNLLLQRVAPAKAALGHARSAIANVSAECGGLDLQTESDVVEAAIAVSADRIVGVEQLVAGCLATPDRFHPWVVTTAADMATFVAIYRFDFAKAHQWQEWAATYHRRTSGPFSVMYGHCFDGIAANEELDVVAAENSFRTALRIARQAGGAHSHAARIASALLGDLLCDKGDLDGAERLLDESHELGREGGTVDSMLATYGTGARIKALRGDLQSARSRLDEGRRIAHMLSLPRLAARIDNERIRAGLSVPPAQRAPAREVDADERADDCPDGIATIVGELEEDSAIRLMLEAGSTTATANACVRARALVDNIAKQGRPRASMQATLLLAECLAAENPEEAAELLRPVVLRCAELGLNGLLHHAGPGVLAVLDAERRSPPDG